MTKKRLNTENITSELSGASVFFTRQPQPPPAPSDAEESVARTDDMQTQPQATNEAELQASKQASKHASTIANYQDDVVEVIRKAVKAPGKEVSFVRLTVGEKNRLADIVYTYKRQGKKTSENEINRIAINYILEDYKANGEQSILAKVIAALLA